MCGIFFYIDKKELDVNNLILESNKIKHRGPDESRHEVLKIGNYNIFLNFHRLSINGLDPKNGQPMNIDNNILICNGEIYNYKKLADKYNINLETESDCEIILHLYKRIGPNFINLLDGVFSFVIIDKNAKKIMIGHDPFGIRALYIGNNENCSGCGICSEMKSLYNICDNIDFVKPGSFTIINIGDNLEFNNESYYTFNYDKSEKAELIEYQGFITYKLRNAVRKRLIGDREVGCLLSGGLDSSIITSIVCDLLGDPSKVNTFSIGFEGSPDLISAQKVADYLKTNHTSIVITEQQVIDAIDDTIYHIESNDITTIRASISMFLLSKYIRENTNIKIILSGEGSDEASGSYLYFHNAPNPESFDKECIRLLEDVHMFDALRGDKTTAAWGLEIRVPFFDKEFMNYYMGIDTCDKMVKFGHEKFLLRKSYQNKLPEDIVWRTKDGFSDGVSKTDKPLYSIINEYTTRQFNLTEEEYYKKIFNKYYEKQNNIIPYTWLPKWSGELSNPSGRLINLRKGNSLEKIGLTDINSSEFNKLSKIFN